MKDEFLLTTRGLIFADRNIVTYKEGKLFIHSCDPPFPVKKEINISFFLPFFNFRTLKLSIGISNLFLWSDKSHEFLLYDLNTGKYVFGEFKSQKYNISAMYFLDKTVFLYSEFQSSAGISRSGFCSIPTSALYENDISADIMLLNFCGFPLNFYSFSITPFMLNNTAYFPIIFEGKSIRERSIGLICEENNERYYRHLFFKPKTDDHVDIGAMLIFKNAMLFFSRNLLSVLDLEHMVLNYFGLRMRYLPDPTIYYFLFRRINPEFECKGFNIRPIPIYPPMGVFKVGNGDAEFGISFEDGSIYFHDSLSYLCAPRRPIEPLLLSANLWKEKAEKIPAYKSESIRSEPLSYGLKRNEVCVVRKKEGGNV